MNNPQISPYIFVFLFGGYLRRYFKRAPRQLFNDWIVGMCLWMHCSGVKLLQCTLSWKRSLRRSLPLLLLLFLQVLGLFPLYIVVNIGPKLLELIPQRIETHLRPPI